MEDVFRDGPEAQQPTLDEVKEQLSGARADAHPSLFLKALIELIDRSPETPTLEDVRTQVAHYGTMIVDESRERLAALAKDGGEAALGNSLVEMEALGEEMLALSVDEKYKNWGDLTRALVELRRGIDTSTSDILHKMRRRSV